MSLIVAPAAGAESYISVADATAYHAARGNAAWGALASDTIREQLLRKATDYMLQAYGPRWKGTRVAYDQALDWPRYDAVVNGYYVDSEIVPVPVANACAELALRAATASLSPDQGPQKKSTTVGPISVTYADGTRQNQKFTAADNMVAPYLMGGTSMIAVVRA
jgi:hypothetical protein